MAEIYGLFDASGGLRYIGKANNSAKRLSGHMRDARRRRTPVYDWINKHGRPEMRVLHICRDGEDWRIIEKRLIAEARERGERLLNLADGGDEPFCPIEVRRANGRKSSGPTGYLQKVKTDRLTGLIHAAKREFAASLRLFEKRGDAEAADRMRNRMRMLASRLPEHFPNWLNV